MNKATKEAAGMIIDRFKVSIETPFGGFIDLSKKEILYLLNARREDEYRFWSNRANISMELFSEYMIFVDNGFYCLGKTAKGQPCKNRGSLQSPHDLKSFDDLYCVHHSNV